MPRKWFAMFVFALIIPMSQWVGAAEVREYRFLDSQERLFKFRGGLLGIDISAQLAGSFKIMIADDGASQLTQFDVDLIDVLDEGLRSVGWADGTPLEDRLFLNPVGLVGTNTGTTIQLGDSSWKVLYEPVLDDPGNSVAKLVYDGPSTLVKIEHINSRLAKVFISSTPVGYLDNPAFTTAHPGILAQLVPEPATTWLLILGASMLPCLIHGIR